MCVVLLLFTVRWNLNDEQKHQRLNFMKNLATGLVFIIVVVNVFITAFGVHRTNYSNWPRTHTGTSMYVCMHYFHSLSLLPSLFSNRYFLSCLTLQFAPKNFHVVSMFLLYSSSDRTFTITYMTYKHSDLSRLAEKFPPENNSNKIHSCSFTRKSLSHMAAGTERK